MQLTARSSKIMVSADGTGIASQADGLLLTRTLRITGLDRGLDAALDRWRPARAVHAPGKIIADLAVAVALGGDCLADVAMLRAQPELFGMPSHPADQPETIPATRKDTHGPRGTRPPGATAGPPR